MKMIRCEGRVTMRSDDCVLLEFGKVCIAFDDSGKLYTNLSEIIVKSDINGNVENHNIKCMILIDRCTKFKTTFNYMFSALLAWDKWALMKEIKKIVGAKNENIRK